MYYGFWFCVCGVFVCVYQCAYLSICMYFLCFFLVSRFLCFIFPILVGVFFLSSSCCCYLDASLCSNEREIKSVNLDGWESGENLRGDGGGSHNQNILYERKFISNLKSRRKMNFKVRTTEKNCLCCLLIVLIKLQHKYYLAPKSRPVPWCCSQSLQWSPEANNMYPCFSTGKLKPSKYRKQAWSSSLSSLNTRARIVKSIFPGPRLVLHWLSKAWHWGL